VIQGYCGVAAVDEAHHIILEARAHGTGSEQALLDPMVAALAPMASPTTVLTADAVYHSKANCAQLETHGLTANLPDNGYRQRDPRYAGRERHTDKPDALWDKTPKPDKTRQVAIFLGRHDTTAESAAERRYSPLRDSAAIAAYRRSLPACGMMVILSEQRRVFLQPR
jgi:hypothetical protein